jgi:thiamine-phosphate pyrophosphorylase
MNLQYITQDLKDISHQELITSACSAGIKWVQLRMKNRSYSECLQIAKGSMAITKKFGAKLIINDYIEIALEVKADGVHLGKEDLAISEAKKIATPGFIIGGTANTFNDVERLALRGATYIGCGPYRFTKTKEKLSPVLGLEGYQSILRQCNLRNIKVPIVAIGGILPADVPSVMSTGIYGVAISSALTNATDKKETVSKFYQYLHKPDHVK